jgi:hypothetical protein
VNKRNVALLAVGLTLLIAGLIEWVPPLRRSYVLGVFYFPYFLLTILLSGQTHSPSAAAAYTSFAMYTVAYGIVFVVVYAVLLEIYLVRLSLRHLDEVRGRLAEGFDPDAALDGLGKAVAELETRRRKHFVLKPLNLPDLQDDPRALAARALMELANERAVKHLITRFQGMLTELRGAAVAGEDVRALRDRASSLLAPGREQPIVYEGAGLEVTKLRAEVQEIWTAKAARRRAQGYVWPLSAPYQLAGAAGATPHQATLSVKLTSVSGISSEDLVKIWEQEILPELKARHGEEAFRARVD